MTEKKEGDLGNRLLSSGILHDFIEQNHNVEDQTISICQYVATISGIILTVSLSSMISNVFVTYDALIKFALVTLIGSSLFSIVFSLIVVEPSLIKEKSSHFHITLEINNKERYSEKDYYTVLKNILDNEDYAIRSYSTRLKRMIEENTRRTMMLRFSITTLLIGLSIAGFLIVLSSFLRM
jgi:hypothetical protein